MSLIQDALKRKSEETAGAPPAELPVETTEVSVGKKSPQVLLIVLTILLLAGFIAALVGLGIYLIKPTPVKVDTPQQETSSVATVQSVATNAPAPPLKTSAVEVAVAEPIAAPEEPQPANSSDDIVWPELNLTGVAIRESHSLAILNGKMLPVGRKLGDVTLIEVNEGSVVVEYCGKRRTLYMNE